MRFCSRVCCLLDSICMDHPRRLKTLQRALTSTKADALLITHLPNVRYLSGFSGSAGALVITQRSAAFFSDGRYGAQARAEVRGARLVIAKKPPLVAPGRSSLGHCLGAHWTGSCRVRGCGGDGICRPPSRRGRYVI